MEIKDLTKKEFTSFVPTHMLTTHLDMPLGVWKEVNEDRDNWLEHSDDLDYKCISKISDEIVVVIGNESYEDDNGDMRYVCTIYKGKLS